MGIDISIDMKRKLVEPSTICLPTIFRFWVLLPVHVKIVGVTWSPNFMESNPNLKLTQMKHPSLPNWDRKFYKVKLIRVGLGNQFFEFALLFKGTNYKI